MLLNDKVLARFWAKVKKSPKCWEWMATLGHNGYGIFGSGISERRAHRISYLLVHGPIPDGMIVMHTCDNRKCVNPAHLKLGTLKENSQDMAAKGRQRQQNKTHCPRGHALEGANLLKAGTSGHRRCRTCHYAKVERRRKAALEAKRQSDAS